MRLINFLLFFTLLLVTTACDDSSEPSGNKIQLQSIKIGDQSLVNSSDPVPTGDITIIFTEALESFTTNDFQLKNITTDANLEVDFDLLDQNKIVVLKTSNLLDEGDSFLLEFTMLSGVNNGVFDGGSFTFTIAQTPLTISSITFADTPLERSNTVLGLPVEGSLVVTFNYALEIDDIEAGLSFIGQNKVDLEITTLDNTTFTITPAENLNDLQKYNVTFGSAVASNLGVPYTLHTYSFTTFIDDEPDFPVISDDELLTLVQSQTFKYFWDFGHPNSGLARERNTSGNTVTSGGSGFGLMAMIVGVERGFITRDEAVERWDKVITFLETADRFHGVWSHWINGNSGAVQPFSQRDNGGDLVETAFLIQGLITVRQYLNPSDSQEGELINRINSLWQDVEWDWYTKGGEKQLYWHWSPEYEWAINLPVSGHNETMIVYVLAAASPTHTIDKETYDNGYAKNGGMVNGNQYYGYTLPLGYAFGGPLFFAHYSYLGLDPRKLEDQYANHWEQNVAHSLINRAYCIDNPQGYYGYSENNWGLTASDNHEGYSAHSPTNDKGVITPTAAISSIPYTPEESMDAIKFFYYDMGKKLWGEYGFYDAFNLSESWYASSYLAIDQGPIICMIENHRTQLLWELFMSAPEIQQGLTKLGFTYE